MTRNRETTITDIIKMNIIEAKFITEVGKGVLSELRDKIGHNEYDKIMSEPIKGCSCGYIKDGNDNPCPKCEDYSKELNGD
jgi:rubrerythrin